jgi:hypothetical protein
MPIGAIKQSSKGMISLVRVHLKKPKQLLLERDKMETQVVEEGEYKALKDRLSELDDT